MKHENQNTQGEYHRTDGPAVIYANGRKVWYQHGLRHRTDGPAVDWINNKQLSEAEFLKQISENKINDYQSA